MKRLLGILIAILMTATSQASMSQSGNEHFGKPTAIVVQQQIVTRSVPVRVKKIIKSKVVRYIPFSADDTDDIFIQEEDLATGYRRRDINRIEHPDDISENVRWRLFLARQLALIKFREIHNKGA